MLLAVISKVKYSLQVVHWDTYSSFKFNKFNFPKAEYSTKTKYMYLAPTNSWTVGVTKLAPHKSTFCFNINVAFSRKYQAI